MMKSVRIDCDESGNYSVGEMPGMPSGGMEGMDGMKGQEGSQMKPAKGLDDALHQARSMLQMPTTADGQNPFEEGFKGVRGSTDIGGGMMKPGMKGY